MDELSKRTDLVDASIAKTEAQLKAEYVRITKRLKNKLRLLYQEIEDDGDVLLSHLYQYNRYYDLLNLIQTELGSLGGYEKKLLEENLVKLYQDNANIINQYGNVFTPFLDKEKIKEVVNKNWGGRAKNWSDSIWSNTREVAERIRQDMMDIITTGKSYKEIGAALANDMGVRYHQAERLIRTESARVAIQSSINTYSSIGIDKVRVITAHDDRVCSEKCEEHKGDIIPIKQIEVGVNVPPFHPNCRCDIVAVWEDDNNV